MNRLYKEVSEELLLGLRRYMNSEISYEETKRLSTRESLAFKSSEWSSIIEEKTCSILNTYRKVYDEILRIEENVKMAEKLNRNVMFDVEMEALLGHSEISGRNRAQPKGYEASNLYLPPFPSLMLADALNKTESDISDGE